MLRLSDDAEAAKVQVLRARLTTVVQNLVKPPEPRNSSAQSHSSSKPTGKVSGGNRPQITREIVLVLTVSP